ncbi:MAG: selenium-dependent molybdenum cofactor biosynthesis protein YqeB [Acidimicrobiia bacterium]
MLFGDSLVVIRGGGDLASGVTYKLHAAGFPAIVLELDQPLAIRRTVAFASAVADGKSTIEGVEAVRVDAPGDAVPIAQSGTVAVLVSPTIPKLSVSPAVVVDARMAKRNLDTSIDQAPLVVALGPGFTAGLDCHAVVETMRGHRLGRVIWEGSAAPDTGVPGTVGSASSERIVRAPMAGPVGWNVAIGDLVDEGQTVGRVGTADVVAPLDGVVRGLITPGFSVDVGMKIGDIDPRADRTACFEVSDKSRLVGGGVLEAVLTWLNRTA